MFEGELRPSFACSFFLQAALGAECHPPGHFVTASRLARRTARPIDLQKSWQDTYPRRRPTRVRRQAWQSRATRPNGQARRKRQARQGPSTQARRAAHPRARSPHAARQSGPGSPLTAHQDGRSSRRPQARRSTGSGHQQRALRSVRGIPRGGRHPRHRRRRRYSRRRSAPQGPDRRPPGPRHDAPRGRGSTPRPARGPQP